MGKFSSRRCTYLGDRERIVELLLAYRTVTGVRLYPTIWRVRLLLTSRVWEPEQDTRIWENESGQIAGLALLWRRRPTSPYLVLDRFVHPSRVTDELGTAMLQWGSQRARAIVEELEVPLTVFASRFPGAISVGDRWQDLGFAPLAPDPDKHNVYLSRSLHAGLPDPMLPAGYAVRPLRGAAELEAYRSLYGFAQVDPLHQRECIESDEYGHLLVVDPEGQFVAYCECSVCRVEWRESNQRIGWIDYVQTQAQHRRQGLGRAILLAGLARLREWGADTAMLVSVSTNIPALGLYNRTGFERVDLAEPQTYQQHIPVP